MTQIGEKGKKAVHYVYYVPKSPYCASISVPELFPDMHRYEARNGDPKPCPNGNLMQMMSMKNIAFTFLFRSPDQETYPGLLTNP